MDSLINELYALIKQRENGHLEFKEAKNNYDSDKLTQYCCALANEGGGKILLGITDKIPRSIVGSQVQKLLIELKAENRAYVEGRTSASIWFPSPINK